jgi:hypothetical protein
MKITLNRVNDNYHFELINERGHVVNVDNRAEFGGNDLGASPMELLLMGVAGCSAIDIISILKKQKQPAYQIINPGKKYVMKYTTVSGVDGFDGSRKEAPKAVVKAIL